MAIRALLLSGDDKAVLAVTQILDELEIAFEHSTETTFGIKRLANQRFDLILIDCDNEQNATLIFNCIRGSALNKAVIAIAIVNGRGGVPTAFRLGASLVVTKVVALEQARSTLRTALGMLRKETPEPRTTITPAVAANVATPEPTHGPLLATNNENQADAVAVPDISATHLPADNPLHGGDSAVQSAVVVSAPPRPADAPGAEIGAKIVPFQARPRTVQPERAAALPAPIPIKVAQSEAHAAPPAETKKENESQVPDEGFSGPRNNPAARNRALALTAASAMLVGAAICVVWITQPKFRTLASYEFGQLQLSISGLRTEGPSFLSAKTTPVQRPSQSAPSEMPSSQALQPSSTESSEATADAAPTNTAVPEKNAELDSSSTRLNPPAPANATDEESVEKLSHAAVKGRSSSQDVQSSSSLSPHNLKHAVVGMSTESTLLATTATQKAMVKPGGPLVLPEDVADDSVVSRVRAVYPKLARQKKAHGPVLLQVTVNKDGKVDTIQVLDGSPLLAQSAIDAVKQWRYRPYLHRGEAVAFQTTVSVDFLP